MNIYLVKRTSEVEWDEYESMVIIAKDEDSARHLFRMKVTSGDPIEEVYEDYVREDPLSVEVITPDKEGVVCTDFRAG